jgi:hypothetical protein
VFLGGNENRHHGFVRTAATRRVAALQAKFWNHYFDTIKIDAIQIRQYRPMCLLNVSFKIFTEVGINRITSIAPKVIKPTQTACLYQGGIYCKEL